MKEQFSRTSPALQEYIRQLQEQAKSRKSTSQSKGDDDDDDDDEMDWEPAESDSEPEELDERDDHQTGAFRWEEPSTSFPAGPPPRSSFDNRTYTMNINSNNVNQTTIQDSYNDNSTSTVVREKACEAIFFLAFRSVDQMLTDVLFFYLAKRRREEPEN